MSIYSVMWLAIVKVSVLFSFIDCDLIIIGSSIGGGSVGMVLIIVIVLLCYHKLHKKKGKHSKWNNLDTMYVCSTCNYHEVHFADIITPQDAK